MGTIGDGNESGDDVVVVMAVAVKMVLKMSRRFLIIRCANMLLRLRPRGTGYGGGVGMLIGVGGVDLTD